MPIFLQLLSQKVAKNAKQPSNPKKSIIKLSTYVLLHRVKTEKNQHKKPPIPLNYSNTA